MLFRVFPLVRTIYYSMQYSFNSSFLHNILLVLQAVTRKNFQKLHEPVDNKAWGDLPPVVVNAFFEAPFNRISM